MNNTCGPGKEEKEEGRDTTVLVSMTFPMKKPVRGIPSSNIPGRRLNPAVVGLHRAKTKRGGKIRDQVPWDQAGGQVFLPKGAQPAYGS
jgi:hypothetical protein